jgi:alpha-galactosidase
MLEVGVTNTQSVYPPLSYVEARTNFGAWCIVSSPLILGLNVTDEPTIDAVWDIVSNTEAIAVNQEYAGFSGSIFLSANQYVSFSPCSWIQSDCTFPAWQYLYKPLHGSTAVLLMNNAAYTTDLTVTFASIPGFSAGSGSSGGSYTIRDLWAHDDLGSFNTSYTAKGLTPHDSAFILITPA